MPEHPPMQMQMLACWLVGVVVGGVVGVLMLLMLLMLPMLPALSVPVVRFCLGRRPHRCRPAPLGVCFASHTVSSARVPRRAIAVCGDV
jgi:hypothetical protein